MLHEATAKNVLSLWLHLSRRHGLSVMAETIVLIIPLGVHTLEDTHTHIHSQKCKHTHTHLLAAGSLLDHDRELSQRTIPC